MAGDPRHANQVNTLDVEGVLLLDPDGQDHFDEFLITVTVSDGRLTVRPGAGSLNAKIAFIDITGGGAPANQPPSANAGNDQTVTDGDNSGAELVTLDASASADTDGTIVAYQWNADSGVAIADGISTQVNFPVGVHVVTLTVTDDDGATDSDTVTITVNAATPDNQPPTANAGNDQTVIDSDNSGAELVTLDASASADTDGTIVAYQWNADSGVAIADGVSPQVDFPVGVHVVTLTVTDDDGASDSDTVTITVNAATPDNQPPTANAGNDQTVIDSDNSGAELVTLDVSASADTDGTIVAYQWNADSGVAIPDGVSPQVDFPVGVHVVTLTVTDDDGATDSDTVTITVNAATPDNQPPTANAGNDQTVTDSDNSGAELVTLDASASADTDGTIVAYQWNADSGVAILDGVSPQVDFPVGVHVVTLTVTDDDGASDSDTVTITVNPAETGDDERVSEGLMALYTFEEGEGATVGDVSGTGAALNLTISDPNRVTWLPGGGLSVNATTLIGSSQAGTKIVDACRNTDALTIEAWIKPANVTQDGPARIVTLSQDPYARNFMLGQGRWGTQPKDVFDIRLRTTETDDNGRPAVTTPRGTATTQLTHVAYSRSADGAVTIYISGMPVFTGQIGGALDNWDNGHRLALAGELDDTRHWLGELHLIAIYCQALDQAQIEQNFSAGP